MRLRFKIQPYQTQAVEAVAEVFSGQGREASDRYLRDMGRTGAAQLALGPWDDPEVTAGYRNRELDLTDSQLLENIRRIQARNMIPLSDSLEGDLGRCSLDVEMETGTGKTYVYIKTMFELNRRYGWSKFIVVVPSIAIREGVRRSFALTADHFMESYGKKARYFVYNSRDLIQLDHFSTQSGITAMIINTQAFAASLREGGRSRESRIIYSARDEFASRRPIDVIRANRPIVILDEPQKMGGEVTRRALKSFDPLFTLHYSATHAQRHNLVYALDALDAYQNKLVKRIEVKGFALKNLRGADRYLFLERIVLSRERQPMARLELERTGRGGITRVTRTLRPGDRLYDLSNQMEQYRGLTVTEVDPLENRVVFSSGESLAVGEATGVFSERDLRRIQIRETIVSHFEKEAFLFSKGIKTLSLFFIDQVASYRVYGEDGQEELGEYGRIFEQEYLDVLSRFLTKEDTPYQRYLRQRCADPEKVHRGYFSVDRKTGRSVDSAVKRGMEFSDDLTAYELILTNQERLLSFEEPTRFIFSHSALREGWDNPNVFQICTLKRSDSQTMKRQEVGRGLRLCVSQEGERMDEEVCGEAIHHINRLTVIASESYELFVAGLQRDIRQNLRDRPSRADAAYFEGREVMGPAGPVFLDRRQANLIHRYLIRNGYVDDETDQVTDRCLQDLCSKNTAPLPAQLADMAEGIFQLLRGVFDPRTLDGLVDNGRRLLVENPLNENFYGPAFQLLWGALNRKFAYRVSFDSGQLIRRAVDYLNEKLFVPQSQYTTTLGRQKEEVSVGSLERGESFQIEQTRTRLVGAPRTGAVAYDLVGKVAEGAALTRRTAAAILGGIRPEKLELFGHGPEAFISRAVRLIQVQKALLTAEHVTYYPIEGTYDADIFTTRRSADCFERAYPAKKHIQDYVFTDGTSERSVERRFAEALDAAEEVCVYAKLPLAYSIPTPLGRYTPDWAIALCRGAAAYELVVAETKGSEEDPELRIIEKAKIDCARRLFHQHFHGAVRYFQTESWEALLSAMDSVS